MNLELFAFVNRQLAGMLRAGLPLESGLRQVARDLQKGRLRDELEQLEADRWRRRWSAGDSPSFTSDC